MRIVAWIILPLVLAVMAAFAIANRHAVVISADPFPFELDLPLYAVLFGGVFFGLLLGGMAAWWRQRHWRRETRRLRREIKRLGERTARASPPIETPESPAARLIDAA